LLVRGRGEQPLAHEVDLTQNVAHSPARRPSLEPDDLAIL
jgi:hypothetical protein